MHKTEKKYKKKGISIYIDINEKCHCPTSYFSPHRKGKCALNNIISYFDDEDDNIDKLLIQEEEQCCFRCGRKGHYVSCCYASKHINGYYLHPL